MKNNKGDQRGITKGKQKDTKGKVTNTQSKTVPIDTIMKSYFAYFKNLSEGLKEEIKKGNLKDQKEYYMITNYTFPHFDFRNSTVEEIIQRAKESRSIIYIGNDKDTKEIESYIKEREKLVEMGLKKLNLKQTTFMLTQLIRFKKDYIYKGAKLNNWEEFLNYILEEKENNFGNILLTKSNLKEEFKEEVDYEEHFKKLKKLYDKDKRDNN